MQGQPSALVLDGNERSALATVRALGKRGFRVVVGTSRRQCIAGVSRYCNATFRYPSPDDNPEGFIRSVAHALSLNPVDYVLPMTDSTVPLVLGAGKVLGNTVPFGPEAAFSTLSHKGEVLRLARDAGVSVPQSREMEPAVGIEEVNDAVSAVGGFPVVLKPCCSRIWSGKRFLSGKVKVVASREELEAVLGSDPVFRYGSFLVQDVIQGYGAGLFVLFDGGTGTAWFSHRRIRERPPAGGVSTLSESTSLNEPLQKAAEKILKQTGWQGPAMIEFKIAPDGVPYLMEINARFWGSLQLAIDSGIDFPYLSCNMGRRRDDDVSAQGRYKVGVRNRWFLGDLDHLYLTFRGNRKLVQKFRTLASFVLAVSDRSSRNEVFRLEDIKPGIIELLQYFRRNETTELSALHQSLEHH